MKRNITAIIVLLAGLLAAAACGPAEETAQMATDMDSRLRDVLDFDPAVFEDENGK